LRGDVRRHAKCDLKGEFKRDDRSVFLLGQGVSNSQAGAQRPPTFGQPSGATRDRQGTLDVDAACRVHALSTSHAPGWSQSVSGGSPEGSARATEPREWKSIFWAKLARKRAWAR